MIFTHKNTKELIKVLGMDPGCTMEALHRTYEILTTTPDDMLTEQELQTKTAALKIVRDNDSYRKKKTSTPEPTNQEVKNA